MWMIVWLIVKLWQDKLTCMRQALDPRNKALSGIESGIFSQILAKGLFLLI